MDCKRRRIITKDGEVGYLESIMGDKAFVVLDSDCGRYMLYREEFEYTEED